MAESWDDFPDAGSVATAPDNATPASDWGQFPDAQPNKFAPGALLGDMTQKMLDAPPDHPVSQARRIPNRILYGLNRWPVMGKVLGLSYNVAVMKAAGRIRDDKAGPNDYAMVANHLATAKEQGDQSTLQTIADAVGHLPAFGTEFALTGGAFSGVRQAATTGLGSAAKSLVGQAAAASAGVAAQAAANPQLVGQQVVQRMMPPMQMQTTPTGEVANVNIGEGSSFAASLPPAFLDTMIELGSERTGSHIMRGLGSLAKKLSPFQRGVVATWLAKPGRTLTAAEEVLKSGGFDGMLGEIAEERLGEAARIATGLQSPGDTVLGQLVTAPGQAAKQLGIEAATFAVPGAVGAASHLLPQQTQPDPALQSKLDAIQQQYVQGQDNQKWLEQQALQRDQSVSDSAYRQVEADQRQQRQEADRAALDKHFRENMPQDVQPDTSIGGIRQLPLSPETQLPDHTPPPVEQPQQSATVPMLPNPISEIYDPRANQAGRETELQAMTLGDVKQEASQLGLPKSLNKEAMIQQILAKEAGPAAAKSLFRKKLTDGVSQTQQEIDNAQTVRSDQGQAVSENAAQGSQEARGNDLQQPASVETGGATLGQAQEAAVPTEQVAKKRRGKKPEVFDRPSAIKELADLENWLDTADVTDPVYDSKSIKAQLLAAKLKESKPPTSIAATAGYGATPTTEPAGEILGYGAVLKPKPAPAQPSTAPIVQQVLYGKGFVGSDVVPRVQGAVGTLTEAAAQLQSTFAPQTRGPLAQQMKGLARHHGAELQRRRDIATAAFASASKQFNGRDAATNFDFIDRMESGAAQPDTELDKIAGQLRKLLDDRREEVRALGTGKLEHFIQDYFPHIWAQPDQAAQAFASILGKRPLEGPKAFLKQRTIDTFKEGIAAGLTPVTDNPVDLALLKVFEVDRYILGQRLLQDMKARGLATYVPVGTQPETGMELIDDKIATVYGAPTIPVSEHVNKSLWDALNSVASNLGVTHERLATARRALGYSIQGGNKVVTKANTDLSVLAHEISHQLDYKYDLQGQFLRGRGKAFQDQLRALADLHESRKRYFRRKAEKMATLLEAYVRLGPNGMRSQAPDVAAAFEKFLNSTPELKPLLTMGQTLATEKITTEHPHGGLLIRGHWYSPSPAANVINNYLSPGLRARSGVFRTYLGLANVMNQFQLGWSFFHLGFTSMDAMTSKLSLAIQQAAAGKPVEALQSALLGLTPAAAITNAVKGDKLLREWTTPGSQGAEIAQLVDGLVQAGGRVKQDEFYRTNMVESMLSAFRGGNVLGGILRAPFALTDAVSKPVMEWIVPRQKLGVFADMAALELEKLGPNAKQDAVREALSRAWDSADNRMGQVVYDNLFWRKAAKEIGMASVRSLGWNLGTFRELGGGGLDWLKAGSKSLRGQKPELTSRMAYTLAMPALVAVYGGVIHYLLTGKPPEELKDWFYPKTGKQDEYGHEQRLSLPSYMKDVYAYGQHPLRTLGHKLHPAISSSIEMLNNQDFYGTKIRNEDDPLVRQAIDVAEHLAAQFIPFAIRGQQQLAKGDASIAEQALPFVGVTPAPASITHSKAEELASELLRQKMPQGSRTKEQATESQFKSHAAKQLAGKKATVDEIRQQAEQQGVTISDEDVKSIEKRSGQSPLQFALEHLDAHGAMKVWQTATPKERGQITDLVAEKVASSKSLSDKDKAKMAEQLGQPAVKTLHEHQVREAVTLAKHVVQSRPSSLTAKEKSAGKTLKQKQDQWQAQRDEAKAKLASSPLGREDVLQAFSSDVRANMKDRAAEAAKIRHFRQQMGWFKQLGPNQ